MDLAIRSLVDHATQGFTEEVYAEALALGYDGFLEQQLDPDSIDDSVAEQALRDLKTLHMSGPQLYAGFGGHLPNHQPVHELRTAMLLRSVLSRRQLLERVVEFWTDHLNIDQIDGDLRLLKTVDDREVVRAHALGRFPDMLRASARSPAMLYYLDNYLNVAGSPNENYARELMELHTLGVEGGYTENDVREVARCFTGWTIDFHPTRWGTFRFDPQRHDPGAKQVLGHVIPAGGGESDADTVLDLLVTHPSTARFVAGKLTSWMLGYDPPEPLLARVTATYLATGGDVRAMLRSILARHTVLAAEPYDTQKLKRPFHFVVSLLRTTRAKIDDTHGLLLALLHMGHAPYNWSPPDGYPDDVESWGDLVLKRWELATRLLSGDIPGALVRGETLAELRADVPASRLVARFDAALSGGRMPPGAAQELQSWVDSLPVLDDRALREVLAMVASSPTYQHYGSS